MTNNIPKLKLQGFTIVELLIVIVVIGILAAITVVAFNGIQSRAHNTAARQDMAAIAKKMQLYKVDSSSDSYPTSGQLSALGLKLTASAYAVNRNNIYYCRTNDGQRYVFSLETAGGQGVNLIDGQVTEVAANTVNSANTCGLVESTSTYAQAVGYDHSGGNKWNESWTGLSD